MDKPMRQRISSAQNQMLEFSRKCTTTSRSIIGSLISLFRTPLIFQSNLDHFTSPRLMSLVLLIASSIPTTIPDTRHRNFEINKPWRTTELRCLVKYFKVLGIFLWKLAADVESYMISEISSGIPPGFAGLDNTSSFGTTCMCTSLSIAPEVFTTSTRRYSAFTVAFP